MNPDTYRDLNVPLTIEVDTNSTLLDLLGRAIDRFGKRPAFRSLSESLSYAEVGARSNDFCSWLRGQGVAKGDRIAVMLPNVCMFAVVTIGVMRAGAAQVNVNPNYTARELNHQLRDSECCMAVVWHEVLGTLEQAIQGTDVRTVVVVGGDGQLDSAAGVRTVSMGVALNEGATRAHGPAALRAEDTLFLQYTGGTTGASKGAVLSHSNVVSNIAQFRAVFGKTIVEGDEVIVTAIPLYHIFALTVNFFAYFCAGATNWLVANPRNGQELIGTIKMARPTAITGVNTLFAAMVASGALQREDFSRLRLTLGGGSSILQVTSERWQELTGSHIREGYGLSETSPIISVNPPSLTGFTGTSGLPLPNTHIKLIDDDGHETAEGVAGEICVSGPQVMRGYWNDGGKGADVFTRDGYFKTGDIGVLDKQGFLKIVDRKKDMILVSGFNVFPNEVEAVASACKGVAECACIGVPDEKTGEAVCLYVVSATNAVTSEAEIREHCRKSLAAYKVPTQVEFVDELPKSSVGKILRRALRGA